METSLPQYLQKVSEGCTECGACVKSCAFLSRYGTPKAMVAAFDFTTPEHQRLAYECSLCGLCSAVCPEKLDPARIFMESRRCYVNGGNFKTSQYKVILGYERRGISSLFSWYGLPEGCDTVFFPGCGLPGTRPEATLRLFRELQQSIAHLGIVLDCCTKPSHDLGRQDYFHATFGEMVDYLRRHGIQHIVVACPNCYKIFQEYGKELVVSTAYQFLAAAGHGASQNFQGWQVTVHDPCALRAEPGVQRAVRDVLHKLGVQITEMEHTGCKTLCCGEGGMVGCVKPELAKKWAALRKEESAGLPMVTYCVGCTQSLGRVSPTLHIVDLLYQAKTLAKGGKPGARAPFTYLNRFLLKRRLQKELVVKTSRAGRSTLGK